MKDPQGKKEMEHLTLKYMDSLWGFAINLAGDRTEAADLLQDTFVRAYNHYDRFEPGTNCKAWLFTIMKNIFINRFHERRREVLPLESEEDDFPPRSAGKVLRYYNRDDPKGGMEIFKQDIQMALKGLPERLRIVVILKDIEGFNYKEISHILNCPMGTVMSRLSRGREQLKHALMVYNDSAHLGAERH